MVAELCVPPVRTGHAEEGDAGDRRVSFPRRGGPSSLCMFLVLRTVGHRLKCPAKLSVLAPWGSVRVTFMGGPRAP